MLKIGLGHNVSWAPKEGSASLGSTTSPSSGSKLRGVKTGAMWTYPLWCTRDNVSSKKKSTVSWNKPLVTLAVGKENFIAKNVYLYFNKK
jgi:hypothetical protein